MEAILPIFFALLGAGTLLLGLVALWQSLRGAFGATELAGAAFTAESATVERQQLLDEKASLLENIRDLEFEHQVGKLSDADHERLTAALRSRAREVLRLLDADLGPYREKAEALVKEHVAKEVGSAPYREPREPASEPAPRLGADLRVCSECGTTNDPDAKFCKECAHRFDGGATAAVEEAPAAAEEAPAAEEAAPEQEEEK